MKTMLYRSNSYIEGLTNNEVIEDFQYNEQYNLNKNINNATKYVEKL